MQLGIFTSKSSSEDKEMYKKVWRTCKVVVFLNKPIAFWRSRCRCHRRKRKIWPTLVFAISLLSFLLSCPEWKKISLLEFSSTLATTFYTINHEILFEKLFHWHTRSCLRFGCKAISTIESSLFNSISLAIAIAKWRAVFRKVLY